ncbi:PstS family phosphate ABC transporter substrate-binding protein [Magnetospira sp. QH-2]|uniref:PstS family phosphate ABC transporter substrate-binding protein n=1 Tax=Magnetospira sp. (strain QH-2) TaxID=1288970 RepID=UPI0003E80A8E|nr:substrate-binding domain-containing protein [Magnetospira sp. QH-2]CCQ74767.1 putative extracellular solute-binding protein, family 1 [Magnetospira sp. QH-2]
MDLLVREAWSCWHPAVFALLISMMLAGGLRAEPLAISGTGSSIATIKLLSVEYQRIHPDTQITIIEPAMGSSGSIKGVLADVLQLAFSARPLKPAEREAGLTQYVLGRTPLVIAAAIDNDQAKGLTMDELAAVYDGSVSTWPDGSRLRLILRPSTDSDTTALRAMSPKLDKAMDAALARRGMVFPPTDQEAADWIARTPGAIGSSTLALIVSENRPLKALPLAGVAPTLENLRNGTYPHTKTLHAVTHAQPDAVVGRFLTFLASTTGRSLLAEAGYLMVGN